MKLGTMMLAAGITALGLATLVTPAKAQGPMYDRVEVNLPYSVTVADKTLPPGNYVIQQLRDIGGNSRVLLIYGDNGMKFETSAITIPCLDINTPEHTSVILHHFGPDYYFDKVWVQGKDYGYEFPLPNSLKMREKERMEAVSVAATYSTVTQATTQPVTTQAPEAPPEVAPEAPPVEAPPEANREAPPAPEMPKTSAGWLMMMLAGGSLSGAGLFLRRKK
jgi:LPXTG-motif cell wall-anchored protein